MMSDRIVETNVISYLLKRDTRGDLYQPHLDHLFISFVTVAELHRWSIRHNWGAARVSAFKAKLASYDVLVYDESLAWQWATVMSIKGHPIGPGDAWIAAAALRHGLPLVTRNRKDFEHIPGLTVISEA